MAFLVDNLDQRLMEGQNVALSHRQIPDQVYEDFGRSRPAVNPHEERVYDAVVVYNTRTGSYKRANAMTAMTASEHIIPVRPEDIPMDTPGRDAIMRIFHEAGASVTRAEEARAQQQKTMEALRKQQAYNRVLTAQQEELDQEIRKTNELTAQQEQRRAQLAALRGE